MKPIKLFFITLLFSFPATVLAQDTEADAIVGVWETGNGKAKVKITKVGTYYYGRIAWLKEPLDKEGKTKIDKHNPDPALRSTPILGIKLLSGFEYVGDKEWRNGTIYDPESGKTYNCKITMQDNNSIGIRGYIGISLIGRTDTWHRSSLPK